MQQEQQNSGHNAGDDRVELLRLNLGSGNVERVPEDVGVSVAKLPEHLPVKVDRKLVQSLQ